MSRSKPTPGIYARHSKKCPAHDGQGKCRCRPSYQALVYNKATGKRIAKTLPTISEAKLWRSDAKAALRAGKLAEAMPKTAVREVCEAWLVDARSGVIRTRGGEVYKPGTLRRYGQALRLRVYPALSDAPFYRIKRRDVQDMVDHLVASSVAPSTIGVAHAALSIVYGHAVYRDELEVNPCKGVKVPAAKGRREHIVTPQMAAKMIAVLPEHDRAIWAVAFYAGLRRGELMALPESNVDLKAGIFDVAWSWDPSEPEPGETKGRRRRRVPIPAVLREYLIAARLRREPGLDLFFGLAPGQPFRADRLQERADKAWETAEFDRVTLHDCRHTYASFAIAAGVNLKALSEYMGHASITETLDRYGHLMPGNEVEATGLLDAYFGTSSG